MDDLFARLHRALPELTLLQNEPLARHTSFQIGGPCAVMALPESEAQIKALMALLRGSKITPLIIGRGTDLLVTDAPLDRVAVKLGEGFSRVRSLDTAATDAAPAGGGRLYAEAGCALKKFAEAAAELGLAGLEFAHGIPGSVGGACVMNAGAYGGEMKDVVTRVRILDAAGDILDLDAADCDFSYRHSVFSDSDAVILGCEVALDRDDPAAIFERMRELYARRSAKQPLDLPSAGSTFKRPQTGYAAALIEEAGLKGFRIGNAAVSEKHAGFVVNLGGAAFADVRAVMAYVQRAVYEHSGVKLEPEVRIIKN
ncbi:MAG: UDP-N-acetylmuramate dehydrogenase [Firmicutes bacterium]|nr:UDP-N-acetylmuramate dehydrogenase [Bacillota bacterium]